MFSALFHLLYTYDAIRSRSTIQVVLSCFLNTMLLLFTVMQHLQVKNAASGLAASYDYFKMPIVHQETDFWSPTGRLFLSMSCIVAFCSVFLILTVGRVRTFFSWQSLHNAGADAQMRRTRLAYQIGLIQGSPIFSINR
jgi:hypothetical protein